MAGIHCFSTKFRLGQLQAIPWVMNSPSPEDVLQNFIETLRHTGPWFQLAIDSITPWFMIIGAVSNYTAPWWSILGSITSCLFRRLYASVSIPDRHPLYQQVLVYVAERGLGESARKLVLASPHVNSKLPISSSHQDDSLVNLGGADLGDVARRTVKCENEPAVRQYLEYVPDVGNHAFRFGGYCMTIERVSTFREELFSSGKSKPAERFANEKVIISCLSPFTGAEPIKALLNVISASASKAGTTTMYRPLAGYWDQGIVRPSRYLNTVALNSEVKTDLVADITTFFAPKTNQYYVDRGMQWRRGYLFYGAPGCGKTSFAAALAGHFNLNIYVVSLSSDSLNDDHLQSLFEQLPGPCVVLLEDIDSAGIGRGNMREHKSKKPRKTQEQAFKGLGEATFHDDEVPRGITLSGLLNVLDGIFSGEGFVTIMTSNSPNSLDTALVRPGRVDKKVHFDYATKEIATQLFERICEHSPGERVNGEETTEHWELSGSFASVIREKTFTPAEIQEYLLQRRSDPTAAVKQARTWVEETVAMKAQGANVVAFANGDVPCCGSVAANNFQQN